MHNCEWKHVEDGFWTGPTETIGTLAGDSIIVSAMWTVEDGVNVSIDVGDALLGPADTSQLAATLNRFATLPAPSGVIRG